MDTVVDESVFTACRATAPWDNPQMQRALYWIRGNPEAWCFMIDLVKREAMLQRRISIRWVIEETRKQRFETNGGRFASINNSLSPALARLLTLKIPEIRPYVETRRAAVDDLRETRV